jgi:hypothetical protein
MRFLQTVLSKRPLTIHLHAGYDPGLEAGQGRAVPLALPVDPGQREREQIVP